MSTKSDPLILALAKISRELPRSIDSVPNTEGKALAIQHARDTLKRIEQDLAQSGYRAPTPRQPVAAFPVPDPS